MFQKIKSVISKCWQPSKKAKSFIRQTTWNVWTALKKLANLKLHCKKPNTENKNAVAEAAAFFVYVILFCDGAIPVNPHAVQPGCENLEYKRWLLLSERSVLTGCFLHK